MTPDEFATTWCTLSQADAAGDAVSLADAAWRLYGELGQAQAACVQLRSELVALLTHVRAAVADAAAGAPDPTCHLAHMLACRGWQPEPGVSSAKVLASYANVWRLAGLSCSA